MAKTGNGKLYSFDTNGFSHPDRTTTTARKKTGTRVEALRRMAEMGLKQTGVVSISMKCWSVL